MSDLIEINLKKIMKSSLNSNIFLIFFFPSSHFEIMNKQMISLRISDLIKTNYTKS